MMLGARDYANASIDEVSKLKERFPFLLCGIELGQPLQAPEAAAEITAWKELDFIIGSQHMNRECADFYWLKYDGMSDGEISSLLEDYYAQVLEMCRFADFDVLGHLTYPLRYIVGDFGRSYDAEHFEEAVREIFKALISRGKGIEINTSGLRQKINSTMPPLEYVKLYRELGGEILTIGSDSHRTADLGSGVETGAELAKAAGFKRIAYFEARKPLFIEI